MSDIILECQNCHNQFVYSEYEQTKNTQDKVSTPQYCPICTSIKNMEQKRPAKPK